MSQTTFAGRWSEQTHFTRIAVSAAITFAVMLVLYLMLTKTPSLVHLHAALYRVFETQEQAWSAIAQAVLCFCIGAQLLIAYACALANRRSAAEGIKHIASENYPFYALCIVWSAGFALAVANFAPDFFTDKNANSWNIFGMVVLCQIVGLFAIIVPFIDSKPETEENRVMFFATGKWVPCLAYLTFSQDKLTVTLVVGTFLLDLLLHPVGKVVDGALASAPAEDGPDSTNAKIAVERPVRLNKDVI